MKLYYSRNLNPRVAVAVARHLASPVEYVLSNPRDPRNKAEFYAINPNLFVPVLVEDQGALWETDAIACRLAHLAGSDFWVAGAQAPKFQMWLSWSAHHFTRVASVFYWENYMKPRIGLGDPDERALTEATDEFRFFANVLENTLSDREWLVGDKLSYADFRVATALPFAEVSRLPLEDHAHIRNWSDRLCLLPAWSAPFDGLPDGSRR